MLKTNHFCCRRSEQNSTRCYNNSRCSRGAHNNKLSKKLAHTRSIMVLVVRSPLSSSRPSKQSPMALFHDVRTDVVLVYFKAIFRTEVSSGNPFGGRWGGVGFVGGESLSVRVGRVHCKGYTAELLSTSNEASCDFFRSHINQTYDTFTHSYISNIGKTTSN